VTVDKTSLPAGYSLKSFTYGAVNLLRDPLRGTWSDSELRLTFATTANSWFRIAGAVTGLGSVSGTSSSRGPSTSQAPQAPTIVLTGPTLARVGSGAASLTAPLGPDGGFEFTGIFPGEYTAQV